MEYPYWKEVFLWRSLNFISVGKLMVYTAAAGLDPKSVLRVVLDAGTNR